MSSSISSGSSGGDAGSINSGSYRQQSLRRELKSNLSLILPVPEACEILGGEDVVTRVVQSFLFIKNPRAGTPNETDVDILVQALVFDASTGRPGPPNLETTWSRLTRRASGLDKLAFIKWSVPASSAPFQGPGGHMGLFDCWVHALSSAANNYSATNPSNNSSGGPNVMLPPVVLLPDILITVAICREYREAQRSPDTTSGESKKRWEYALMMMSVFAFRVYDSYQKKGTVTRDTIHRFLSDVHGEDSYKTATARTLLDRLFAAPGGGIEMGDDRMLASLTASQFASGILKTRTGRSHLLLDWIGVFGSTIIPTPTEIPQSTLAYLETLSASHRSMEDLQQQYGLASLYEIKRRFHSLVETASSIFQGDVMKDAAGDTSDQDSSDVGGKSNTKQQPRHVVTLEAFVQAVSSENEELGQGGYLPTHIADLVFRAVCPTDPEGNESTTGGPRDAPSGGTSGLFWALYDVLSFGCDAVRLVVAKQKGDIMSELPMLRFAFKVFSLNSVHTIGSANGGRRRILTRTQIGEMLLLLLEHSSFRLKRDSPPSLEDDEYEDDFYAGHPGPFEERAEALEETQVHIAAASLLAILPPTVSSDASSDEMSHVRLGALVDYVLDLAKMEEDVLSFDGFCRWHFHSGSTHLPLSQRRVGPFIMELRLIASVLFGIPPTKASLELAIVEELRKRHKYRYPQTDTSRRGPRGTVWYILEDRWLRHWASHVQKVSGTESDVVDGRDNKVIMNVGSAALQRQSSASNIRGLGKINNTGLLAENGSLALRADIRWRQDYEICPPLVWSALQAWYDGGPPIHRQVVKYIPSKGPTSPHSKSPRVRTEHEIELYPFFVTIFLCDVVSRGEARPFQQSTPVSRVTPVRVLLVHLCKGLDVDPKYGRLWMMENVSGGSNGESTDDWLLTLDESIVEQRNRRGSNERLSSSPHVSGMNLLLELKDPETGKWPRGLDGKTWSFKDGNKKDGDKGMSAEDGGMPTMGDGVVGLYNMGNTCYLNSSIQCLSHTPIFKDYFTSKAYMNDINTTNPIGHQGRLAQVTAVLIQSIWKRFNQQTANAATALQRRITSPGSYAPVNAPALTPKTFKESLGTFNDHFVGNEQHDAQELLAFLIGGLSEDLNRIVEKPYIEQPDSDGRPDAVLADIWWTNHLKRELSIIVALFMGQYKSLLTCRTCKYESARFEPFTFLQLPLPEDDQVSVTLVYYPITPNTDILKYSVRVKHDGRLGDVLMALAKVLYEDSKEEQLLESEQEQEFSPDEQLQQNGTVLDDDEALASEKRALELRWKEMSQNMAVVDMRDGYIFKIAPNSWSLPDLQNKDTGELPLLHVYELDPVVEVEDDDLEDEEPEEEVEEEDEEEEEEGVHEDEDDEELEEEEEDDEEEYEDDEEEEEEELDDEELEEEEEEEEDDDDDEPRQNGEGETEAEIAAKLKAVVLDDEDENKPSLLNGSRRSMTRASTMSISQQASFLAICQRKSDITAKDMLHPFVHRVFGTPLLLRVHDLEIMTGRDMYVLVAQRLCNVVPKSALRFLQPEADEIAQFNNLHETPRMTRGRRRRTLSEMEEVAAGPVPRYGFRLRITSRDGRRCALCNWYQCCIGCWVPDDDHPTIVMCGDSLVVDWHFAVDIATNGFGLGLSGDGGAKSTTPFRNNNPRSPPTVNIKNHSSCDVARRASTTGSRYNRTAITLEDCLDAFASEERIPEAYCSKCQDFRVQTKRMSLWRLPPVVMIHLKRFQFTQHMRRKLRDLVVFPVEGLDLSRIVAKESVSTATSTSEASPANKFEPREPEDDLDAAQQRMMSSMLGDADETATTTTKATSTTDYEDDESSQQLPQAMTNGRSAEMLYDLYAVIHHQGALSGGHYVASLKSSEDGQWRLFNDAQVYEIHARDVVDASAYILFYIRRDVKNAQLGDFWSIREGQGLSEEEMEKLLKAGKSDRCVIS